MKQKKLVLCFEVGILCYHTTLDNLISERELYFDLFIGHNNTPDSMNVEGLDLLLYC